MLYLTVKTHALYESGEIGRAMKGHYKEGVRKWMRNHPGKDRYTRHLHLKRCVYHRLHSHPGFYFAAGVALVHNRRTPEKYIRGRLKYIYMGDV